LARRLFPGIGRYNLGSVAEALGVSREGEHRAMADAVITWKVFEMELAALRSEGIRSVEEIGSFSAKKRPAIAAVKDYKLSLIEAAIMEQRKLDIIYRSAWDNRVSERTITPKRIHRGYDRFYVVAHCHTKNAERNFRLDCIMKVSKNQFTGA
jgi:predicted DNA-binding transcriptional regulator YafY